MGQGLDVLAVKRVNTIMRELVDIRDIPQSLRFRDRIAVRDATDGEIMGFFTGRVYISDIIMTGGHAVVKGGSKYRLETNAIPKIKHGHLIDEEMVVLLQRLEANGGTNFDENTLRGYVANRIDDILLGIRERENALCVAMMLDDFSYSRGGVVIQGAGWNVPAQFKSRVAVDWSDATNATPIKDITAQVQNDAEVWGEVRNRITLSLHTLRDIFNTAEFKAKAQLYSMMTFPSFAGGSAFPLTEQLGMQKQILGQILEGLIVETEDTRYFDQLDDGTEIAAPFMPRNKVILSNTADDNNPRAAYLGQAVVPETVMSSIANVGSVVGSFSGPSTGPVSYTELNGLNPPDMTLWGVTKCWPVRVRKGYTSILTVG